MKKKEIEKKYKSYIHKLKNYNQYYYQKSKPIVTDSDYDQLKRDIINLENKYKFLKSDQSPTVSVGFKPSKNFNKALHRVPMLSLSNAFSEDDLINFEKNFKFYIKK